MPSAKKSARKPAAKTTAIPIQLAPASAAAALAEQHAAVPAAGSAAQPAQPPKAAKALRAAKADKGAKAKEEKERKPKLVRDSFTIPKDEYGVLQALKQRAATLGRPAKKSELLRAGVQALAAMNDAAFLACVGAVPAVKTGRPAKA